MRKNKLYIFFIVLISIFLFASAALWISCKSTAEETVKEEFKEEIKTQESSEGKIGKDKEVEAYYDKVNEYMSFLNKIIEIDDKYFEMYLDLSNEYSDEEKSDQERKDIAQKIIEIYSSEYDELSEVEAPDYARGVFDSLLESVRQNKIAWSCNVEGDDECASKAWDKADEEHDLYIEESIIIGKYFNGVAEELGLDKTIIFDNE